MERGAVLHVRDGKVSQRGDVVQVGDRHVAGVMQEGKSGVVNWGYRLFVPGEKSDKTPFIRVEDPDYLIDEKINQGRYGFHKLGPPDKTELARFAEAWPAVSAAIGLTPDAELPRLFDPGEVKFPREIVPRVSISPDRWRSFIDADSRGDWGLYGRVVECEVTHAAVWTAFLEPQHVRNSLNLQRRSGGVKSRYLLPDAENGRLPPFPEWKNVRRVVDVLTAFGPGNRNRTIATVEEMGVT